MPQKNEIFVNRDNTIVKETKVQKREHRCSLSCCMLVFHITFVTWIKIHLLLACKRRVQRSRYIGYNSQLQLPLLIQPTHNLI